MSFSAEIEASTTSLALEIGTMIIEDAKSKKPAPMPGHEDKPATFPETSTARRAAQIKRLKDFANACDETKNLARKGVEILELKEQYVKESMSGKKKSLRSKEDIKLPGNRDERDVRCKQAVWVDIAEWKGYLADRQHSRSKEDKRYYTRISTARYGGQKERE